MKNIVTIKHLLKITGKKGEALGTEEGCIYFDGRYAVAATNGATVSIECQQEIPAPVLVSVSDLKTAMTAKQTLHFAQRHGELRINGVRVSSYPTDIMPSDTTEILDLDKQVWRAIVRPFRIDGGRLSQVVTGMATRDVRPYLNGMYFDFRTGAIVATDGHRLHLVEDAIPTVDELPEGMDGVIMPHAMASLLSIVGGVQDVFVMGKTDQKDQVKKLTRVICVAAANARLRIRDIDSGVYPNYRAPFDQNKNLPIDLVLDSRSTEHLIGVAAIATASAKESAVTISGEDRTVTVAYRDRVQRDLAMSYRVGAPFSIDVSSVHLRDAIESAGKYGSAIRLRFGRGDCNNAIYVGSQEFHSIVMARTPKEAEKIEVGVSTAHAAQCPP